MMELADVLDSKSSGSDTVRVRPPLPAPNNRNPNPEDERFGFLFFVNILIALLLIGHMFFQKQIAKYIYWTCFFICLQKVTQSNR